MARGSALNGVSARSSLTPATHMYSVSMLILEWKGRRLEDVGGGISPQMTSFSSALQFIPSSVVAKPSPGVGKGYDSRSRSRTLQFDLSKGVGLDRSQSSQGSFRSGYPQGYNHQGRSERIKSGGREDSGK
jgi:hypothetical protein